MSNCCAISDREEEIDAEHLSELPVGAGCAEIWEHLSDYREAAE